ncbi:IclR family transcriptional regulator [Actinocatenispora rupis]|uniref:IclR family transcriptional regulator n=1 Tax=Actinocatenispora rupis TaxID=519421 RepID=A0A8J3NCE8_9ACTN|nr:IclR family transcriptional regulator [Actinocatenispora rupis]
MQRAGGVTAPAGDRGDPGSAARNQSSSLRRALSILAYVEGHGGGRGVSLSDLADSLSLNKSTILRLSAPLSEAELLTRDAETGRFRLGLGALRLGQAYLSTLDLRTVAAERLRALQRAARETCHLVVYDAPDVVYIDKVENEANVRMGSRVGSRAPMSCTAVGKAILAWVDDAARETAIAAGLPAVTPHTITDPDRLRTELRRIRERGYAVDDRENEVDVRCVAAPLFDHDDRVVGALSVSGLSSRMTPAAIRELAPRVAATGRQISHELGASDTTVLTPSGGAT